MQRLKHPQLQCHNQPELINKRLPISKESVIITESCTCRGWNANILFRKNVLKQNNKGFY